MSVSNLQALFAERIGGKMFGLEEKIYKFEKIKRAKRAALKANPGKSIIDMGVGEPDDMAFPEVVKALSVEAAKWENRTYADNGTDDFKVAAAEYMKDVYGVALDAETQVNHSIGSKSAMALLPAAFINPGDIAIMTVPGYPVLGTWTQYLGGEVVNLPLLEKNDFFPDLDSLTADQKKRAKLLYLNYPNNPTGKAATREFFAKAIAFAEKHQVLIVSDAPYSQLTYNGRPLSVLSVPGGMDWAIELHSMSKGFNMTGWRLGWVCGNAAAVKAFANVKDNADSGQFAAIQKAAIAALRDHRNITPKIVEKYARRLQRVVAVLKELGFNAKMPEGTFYLYVQVPKAVENGPAFATAEDFSQWLIKEKLISAVPWDDVGHYIRFSATFVARGGAAEEDKILADFAARLQGAKFVF